MSVNSPLNGRMTEHPMTEATLLASEQIRDDVVEWPTAEQIRQAVRSWNYSVLVRKIMAIIHPGWEPDDCVSFTAENGGEPSTAEIERLRQLDESYATARKIIDAILAALSASPAPSGQGVSVPEGMKPWTGGDSAPDDWAGGPVLLRDGRTFTLKEAGYRGLIWGRPYGHADGDIIAYTTKPAPAPSCSPGDSEWKRDCWNEFFNEHLTDGNDGYRAASVIAACRAAFDREWPDPVKAASAGLAALSPQGLDAKEGGE